MDAFIMGTTINPIDSQQILQMLQRLITNYRDGQAGRAFFDVVGDLSLEWERQGLPCAISKHGRRDRTPQIMRSMEKVLEKSRLTGTDDTVSHA